MSLLRNKSFHYSSRHKVRTSKTALFSGLVILLLMSLLSSCSTYIASKQDDLNTQIDVWQAENEYGRIFETLNYLKPSHPHYKELLARKKPLQTSAHDYELKIHKETLNLIREKKWAEALDLTDLAAARYPQGKSITKTRQYLLQEQKKQLADIEQKIIRERSSWMIKTRPIYQTKLNTDPRNEQLKSYVDSLYKESETLAQQITLQSRQAIKKKHFITALTLINQAIALSPNSEQKKILSSLKSYSKRSTRKKKQIQKISHKKQQSTLLMDIEKSFKSGNLLITKQLIARLDDQERQNPELIQLEQELDQTIRYTTQHLFADANKLYTDGHFEKAIERWQEILLYDPPNTLAKENIQRAEKVISKLSNLREKQKE